MDRPRAAKLTYEELARFKLGFVDNTLTIGLDKVGVRRRSLHMESRIRQRNQPARGNRTDSRPKGAGSKACAATYRCAREKQSRGIQHGNGTRPFVAVVRTRTQKVWAPKHAR